MRGWIPKGRLERNPVKSAQSGKYVRNFIFRHELSASGSGFPIGLFLVSELLKAGILAIDLTTLEQSAQFTFKWLKMHRSNSSAPRDVNAKETESTLNGGNLNGRDVTDGRVVVMRRTASQTVVSQVSAFNGPTVPR